MAWPTLTLRDVLAARKRIRPYLRPTALLNYPALDELVGATVFVKHENHQPTGAFKVRGGINLVSQLTEEERTRGMITASTGNHGKSIAHAARLFGIPVTVCVPEGANPLKVASMQSLGATVVCQGRDFDDARVHCEALASAHGLRYIHSGDEPHLIAGVGTCTLEILEDEPGIDVIIVPLGGGSGAAGACLVAKAIDPRIEVIAVQSEEAPAAYRSWRARELVEAPMSTYAEGLATRTSFALPQHMLWERLDDFVLVSDEEIRFAQATLIRITGNLVEAAGAAGVAGAIKLGGRLERKRVALVLTGGNASTRELLDVLDAEEAHRL